MKRISIGDQYFTAITINGQEIIFASGDIKILLCQNIQSFLPSLSISFFNQSYNWFTGLIQNGDGAEIQIELGSDTSSGSRSKLTKWRMYGAPNYVPKGSMYDVHMNAILDVPGYLTNRVNKSFDSNSSEVIKSLAGELGFTVEADSTSDKQIWRPGLQTYAKFMYSICDMAYSNDNSYYALGVDENKKLFFKNLNSIKIGSPKCKFALGQPYNKLSANTYPIIDYKIKSNAGTLNNWAGYGYAIGQDGMNGEFVEEKDVNLQKQNNVLEMDKSLKDNVNDSPKFVYMPIDCGNTHENMQKARLQNKRMRSSYSNTLIVLTEFMTDCTLFDPVSASLFDPDSKEKIDMYDSNYIVTAKTRAIWGSRYYEKLWLTSQGKNSDKSGKLV